jgi:HEPN domain-containing protein
MNPLTFEWIKKADGDFATAGRELRARKDPNYDAACFHAQQCAEKYLKAILQERSYPFGRTHNLIALLNLLLSGDNDGWGDARPDLEALTVYAVSVRYPGESADRSSARTAVRHAAAIRSRARRSLALPA